MDTAPAPRHTTRRRTVTAVAVLVLTAVAFWALGREAAGSIGLVLCGAVMGYGLRMTEEGDASPQG